MNENTTSSANENPTRAVSTDDSGRAESIARRAYERYEARGGDHGRDQDDWFEAERELFRAQENS